tara:strand:+ start:352 stop:552 length:201 start_codon:yes stop_codon:yes gene_type:complete
MKETIKFGCLGLLKKMKKYLLLVEDEGLWEKFKQSITKDINSEIMDLIKDKTNDKDNKKKGDKNGK